MTIEEEQPLLGTVPANLGGDVKDPEALFQFDPNGDPDDPRGWPSSFKWAIVLLLACMAFTV